MSREAVKPNRIFRTSGLALRFVRRLLGTRIHSEGIANLTNQPTLFVVNHFTRLETFVMPYVLYMNSGKQVRSLAHKSLFVGAFGDYLKHMGTLSTDAPMRNKTIISDLMKGTYPWIIYPEGVMVKNKDTVQNGRFVIHAEDRVGAPHTGAAVMALKSILFKDDFRRAVEKNDTEKIAFYKSALDVNSPEDLSPLDTVIQPVNLTYYPIRPRDNLILGLAKRFVKNLPSRVSEELTIEGNIMMKGDIDVTFRPPIQVRDFIKKQHDLFKRLPLKNETRIDLLLRIMSRPLTNAMMREIYGALTVNIDHLFANVLIQYESERLSLFQIQASIWLAARYLQTKGIAVHRSLNESNLDQLLSLEECASFVDVFLLAAQEGLLTMEKGLWRIRKNLLKQPESFHEVRLTGTLRVIGNELKPLADVVKEVKRIVNKDPERLREELVGAMVRHDAEIFERDHAATFEVNLSKKKEVAAPFFLRGKKKSVGIVLSHGYRASPGEIRALGEYLNKKGHTVYGVRLKGHGTVPREIGSVKWEEWYDAYNRGVSIIANSCEKIVLAGFSTGGLLSLLAAARKREKVHGVVVINAALRLADIKARFVPAVTFWNDLLTNLGISGGKKEYVDSPPEFPDTNYTRNYLTGVLELEKLMKECEKSLPKIKAPALIVQGKNDPTVVPKSATIIHDKIISANKKLVELPFERHVIVRGPGKEQVFETVGTFIDELGLSS